MKGDVLAALKSGNFRPASASSSNAAQPSSASSSSVSSTIPVAASMPATSVNSYANSTSPRAQQRVYSDVPNSNVRKVIAKRLTQSKQTIPHTYCAQECQIDQ